MCGEEKRGYHQSALDAMLGASVKGKGNEINPFQSAHVSLSSTYGWQDKRSLSRYTTGSTNFLRTHYYDMYTHAERSIHVLRTSRPKNHHKEGNTQISASFIRDQIHACVHNRIHARPRSTSTTPGLKSATAVSFPNTNRSKKRKPPAPSACPTRKLLILRGHGTRNSRSYHM